MPARCRTNALATESEPWLLSTGEATEQFSGGEFLTVFLSPACLAGQGVPLGSQDSDVHVESSLPFYSFDRIFIGQTCLHLMGSFRYKERRERVIDLPEIDLHSMKLCCQNMRPPVPEWGEARKVLEAVMRFAFRRFMGGVQSVIQQPSSATWRGGGQPLFDSRQVQHHLQQPACAIPNLRTRGTNVCTQRKSSGVTSTVFDSP